MTVTEKCFVIIPFNAHYEAIYADVIKPTLAEIEVEAFISKDVKGIEWPFKKIHAGIKDSKFCIADITEPNENVMYEIGYASALEKKTILIWDTSKRAKGPSFDMNYFHGEPYNSEDKTWSSKLARIIKDHVKAELGKPPEAKPSIANSPESFALDERGLKIITILAIAHAKNQEIGVLRMPELLQDLGDDRVDASLCLDQLLEQDIIDRDYNGQGPQVCHYYNSRAANEYLRKYPEAFKKMREQVPDDFSAYQPLSAWGGF